MSLVELVCEQESVVSQQETVGLRPGLVDLVGARRVGHNKHDYQGDETGEDTCAAVDDDFLVLVHNRVDD